MAQGCAAVAFPPASGSRSCRILVHYDGRDYAIEAAPRRSAKLERFATAAGVHVDDLVRVALAAKEEGEPMCEGDDAAIEAIQAKLTEENHAKTTELEDDDVTLDLSDPEPLVLETTEDNEDDEFEETGDEVIDHQLRFGKVRIDPPDDAADATDPIEGDWSAIMGDRVERRDAERKQEGNEEEGEDDESDTFALRVRGRYQPAREARNIKGSPLGAFEKALAIGPASLPDDPVIEWPRNQRHKLAVVDVDWHDSEAPPKQELERILTKLSPWPSLADVATKSGGMHLVYKELGGFTAAELAGAACLALYELFPAHNRPDLELLTRVAFPREGMQRLEQSLSRLLKSWRQQEMIGLDDQRVEQWLSARGFEIGGRYTHERCPFDPRPNDQGGSPVLVTEDGVHCFVCASNGHVSRGHTSFGRLVGTFRNNRILDAAKNWAFYDHQEFVLQASYPGLPPDVLRPAWGAFLKLVNGDTEDPRIGLAMSDFSVVQGPGNRWYDKTTLAPVLPNVGSAVTQQMPSARYVEQERNGDGEVTYSCHVDARRHDLHRTNQPIPGYTLIDPVRGFSLWGQHREYPNSNLVRPTVPTQDPDMHPPRYVSAEHRMTFENVEAYFRQYLPGVPMNVLVLSLLGIGWAQSGVGLVPMIQLEGPSGSGKTTTGHLTAAIIGDTCRLVREENRERFAEALGTAAQHASIIQMDEFGKGVAPSKVSLLYDHFLDVNRNYSCRINYIGPTTLHFNSLILITNVTYPAAVKQNQQLGRRLVVAKLHRRISANWETTCGVGDLRFWRHNQDHAYAADCLLSHIADRFFHPGDIGTWFDQAAELGFHRLEDETNQASGVSTQDTVRELFGLIEKAPPASSRWKGRGWRIIEIDDTDPVSNCWRNLCDDPTTMEGFASSTRVAELDLGAVLGTDDHVRLDLSPHGKKLGIRFIAGSAKGRKAKHSKVNSEIEAPNVTSPSHEATDSLEIPDDVRIPGT